MSRRYARGRTAGVRWAIGSAVVMKVARLSGEQAFIVWTVLNDWYRKAGPEARGTVDRLRGRELYVWGAALVRLAPDPFAQFMEGARALSVPAAAGGHDS